MRSLLPLNRLPGLTTRLLRASAPAAPAALTLPRRRVASGASGEPKVYTTRDPGVSATSTTIPVFSGPAAKPQSKPEDDSGPAPSGLQSDLRVVRETFSGAPPVVMNMGLLGTVPYVATSISTLYLSWDVHQGSYGHATGFLVAPDTAHALLASLEPIQIGLGACILSFLGAVHWGLEIAEYGGAQGFKRYMLGIAPAVFAWPTVLLPTDVALVTQFLGFTGVWFADNLATTRGWAPRWYTSYRFFLTFIVGGCILITLIGRGRLSMQGISTQSSDKLMKTKEKEWQHFDDKVESQSSNVRQVKASEQPPNNSSQEQQNTVQSSNAQKPSAAADDSDSVAKEDRESKESQT